MSERAWPLSPRAARVYYNAADAWLGDAAADEDRVALLGGALADARERRRLARRLRLLEWAPRLLLRSRRGFSWLSRAERRVWLDRLAQTRAHVVRAAVAEIEQLVRAPIEARGPFPP
jgi:hypothetical protein